MDRELKQRLLSDLMYAFSPFAYRCECWGEHKSCKDTLNDPIVVNRMMQLNRIIKYIEENY
jgi:hypothetical protein